MEKIYNMLNGEINIPQGIPDNKTYCFKKVFIDNFIAVSSLDRTAKYTDV